METTNERTKAAGQSAKDSLESEKRSAIDQATEAKDLAKQKASDAYQQLREGSKQVGKDSKEYLRTSVKTQQTGIADRITEFHGAIKAAADQLEEKDHGLASRRISKAANGLEAAANYLRESDPEDLLADLGNATKKRPELVFGGLFLLGLGIARFAKASQQDDNGQTPDQSGQAVFHPRGNFSSSAYKPRLETDHIEAGEDSINHNA